MADVKAKLMKKTKNELIDIILRKDAIEIELNERVKAQEYTIKELTSDKERLSKDIESYHQEIDNSVEQINILNESKLINKVITAIFVVSTVVLSVTLVYVCNH